MRRGQAATQISPRRWTSPGAGAGGSDSRALHAACARSPWRIARTLRLVVLGLVLSACAGTNSGGDAGAGGGTGVDPFATVRNVANGEILCDADNCCIGRCGQADQVCVSRAPALLAERFAGLGCPSLLCPLWFYEYNCFLRLEESRVSTPSDTGKARLYAFVECVCGRSGTAYGSDYSWANLFEVDQCEAPLVWLGGDPLPMLQRCGTPSDRIGVGRASPHAASARSVARTDAVFPAGAARWARSGLAAPVALGPSTDSRFTWRRFGGTSGVLYRVRMPV